GRAARGAGRRDALPGLVRRGAAALRDDFSRQYRRGARPPAVTSEVPDAMRGFWRSGDPLIWLAGAMLGVSLLMVAGLVMLILVSGLGFFWPRDLERFVLADGSVVIGEVSAREAIPDPDA